LEGSEIISRQVAFQWGFAWLDTGTPESLLDAADFVATLEKRQGFRIACPEEISYNKGYIDRNQIAKLGLALGKSDYAKYVQALADRAPVTERPSKGGGSVVV
jgi:dTDP-glucose pyrophosphorylase